MFMIISLFLSIVALTLLRFIYKVIWIPFRVKRMMLSQGITGPSYKFIHGSTKESMIINQQSINDGPMELSSHDIFPRLQPALYTWMTLYGKNFLTWTGTQPQMVITDPGLVKEMLSNKEGLFYKMKHKGAVKKLFGDGLSQTNGEKWSKLRKIAKHAFYAESLKEMFPSMVASVENMLENWKQYEGKEIEVYKEFTLMSSEVISRTAFGSSYIEGKNIFDMITKLMIIIIKNRNKVRLWGIDKIRKSQDDIESDRIEKSLRDSVMEIVRKREERVSMGKSDNYGSDFLGSLLKARNSVDEKNIISIDEVIDECKVFYLAGHETTSSLLAWIFLLLSIHTDWQDKARNEVLQLFGKSNPTAYGLPQMKIVNMIINETLRLYSPIAITLRKSKNKVKLGKYEFPANMEFQVPFLSLHRNQEIWGSDSHVFKPERFSEGIAKATKNNPFAFAPFGYGPRICVGMNFANNEAKIALSMILQRHKFVLSSSYVHSPLALLTTQPLFGIPVILQPL